MPQGAVGCRCTFALSCCSDAKRPTSTPPPSPSPPPPPPPSPSLPPPPVSSDTSSTPSSSPVSNRRPFSPSAGSARRSNGQTVFPRCASRVLLCHAREAKLCYSGDATLASTLPQEVWCVMHGTGRAEHAPLHCAAADSPPYMLLRPLTAYELVDAREPPRQNGRAAPQHVERLHGQVAP